MIAEPGGGEAGGPTAADIASPVDPTKFLDDLDTYEIPGAENPAKFADSLDHFVIPGTEDPTTLADSLDHYEIPGNPTDILNAAELANQVDLGLVENPDAADFVPSKGLIRSSLEDHFSFGFRDKSAAWKLGAVVGISEAALFSFSESNGPDSAWMKAGVNLLGSQFLYTVDYALAKAIDKWPDKTTWTYKFNKNITEFLRGFSSRATLVSAAIGVTDAGLEQWEEGMSELE